MADDHRETEKGCCFGDVVGFGNATRTLFCFTLHPIIGSCVAQYTRRETPKSAMFPPGTPHYMIDDTSRY